jgi:MscS family membrane protein
MQDMIETCGKYFEAWYMKAIVVLILTICFFIVTNYSISLLHLNISRRNALWLKTVIVALRPPLLLLIIGIGANEIVSIAFEELRCKKAALLSNLPLEILIISMTWFSFRFVNEAEKQVLKVRYLQEHSLDETNVSAIGKVVKFIVGAISILIFMDLFGVSTQGLVTFGGVSGIVVGFASKDVLANIMGALTIYLDQPFKIGDWIKIAEKDIEGCISNIGIRCTVIETSEKRPMYVPNSVFAQAVIENASRMSHRKIEATLRISHHDLRKVDALLDAINALLHADEQVDTSQVCKAVFDGSDVIGLNIKILCFTKQTELVDFLNVKQGILLSFHQRAIELDCTLAQPVISL